VADFGRFKAPGRIFLKIDAMDTGAALLFQGTRSGLLTTPADHPLYTLKLVGAHRWWELMFRRIEVAAGPRRRARPLVHGAQVSVEVAG